MGADYRESSSYIVDWDNTELEIEEKKASIPKNSLYWGKPLVVQLKWKCMGTPTACDKHNYPTEYQLKDKYSEYHTQYNSIVINSLTAMVAFMRPLF